MKATIQNQEREDGELIAVSVTTPVSYPPMHDYSEKIVGVAETPDDALAEALAEYRGGKGIVFKSTGDFLSAVRGE